MRIYSIYFTFFYLVLLPVLAAAEDVPLETTTNPLTEIIVDLREPTLCNNVLSTEKGGVISGPDFRIQALKMAYARQKVDGQNAYTLIAEGNLIIEFQDYIFVGDKLEYNFQEKNGIIYNGKTTIPPWFFGGKIIELCSDGSYVIHNGFVTTSENVQNDYEIRTERANISSSKYLTATNIQVRFFNVPLLWVPTYKTDLNAIFDSPLKYSVRWGGKQGSRIGVIYEAFSSDYFKLFLHADYRFRRGPGGGFETFYKSADGKRRFQSTSYVAKDFAIPHPKEKIRYRLQGFYTDLLFDDKVSVDLSYDKLSDREMATDYDDQGIDLEIGSRTQLLVRRQDTWWISNFLTRIQANNFQTVKQELPTLETKWHPLSLGSTGIIINNSCKAAYLDFAYANDVVNVHDYRSVRLETQSRLYKPFKTPIFTLTPQTGFTGIFYSQVPHDAHRFLIVYELGGDVRSNLYQTYGLCKHVLEPYLSYQYLTFPTSTPHQHYIFDIDDGWYRLNCLRMGLGNDLYGKMEDDGIKRLIHADIYAYAFFHTHTFRQTIPHLYAELIYSSLPTLRHTFNVAWDLEHDELFHFNYLNEWTINQNLAVSFEYRHRNRFDWRKLDYTNFILDSFRPERELLHSSLSDRRDTLLLHFFYQFHPSWALEFKARNGWNRIIQPSYTEFEIDLLGAVGAAWNIKLSYQHKEEDKHRFAIYATIGMHKPDRKQAYVIPNLEF